MHTFFFVLMILALLAVLSTLIMGIVGMFRGQDPRRSNKLMRYRVMFQTIAILLMAVFMMLYRS